MHCIRSLPSTNEKHLQKNTLKLTWVLLLFGILFPIEILGQKDFSAYTNKKFPIITDNPASIALLPSNWSYQFDYPIVYSVPNVSKQAIYLKDVYTSKAEQNYEEEDTTIIGTQIGIRKFGLTYKSTTSHFKNKEKESTKSTKGL